MKPRPDTDFPVHELIDKRWSPRAFSGRDIELKDVMTLFEAARWAASCNNQQPWNFIFALKSDKKFYGQLTECLMDGNKLWTQTAPMLILTVAKKTFDYKNKPNKYHYHDIGLAIGNLSIQAASMNLYAHQMAGFYPEKARKICNIPENFDPVSMIAVGYLGNPNTLPQKLYDTEISAQKRKQLKKFVYNGEWGNNININK